jgi:hypothetical protein
LVNDVSSVLRTSEAAGQNNLTGQYRVVSRALLSHWQERK